MINFIRGPLEIVRAAPQGTLGISLFTAEGGYVKRVAVPGEMSGLSDGRIILEATDLVSESGYANSSRLKVDEISVGKIKMSWDTMKTWSVKHNANNEQFRPLKMSLFYAMDGDNVRRMIFLPVTFFTPHIVYELSDNVDETTFRELADQGAKVTSIEIAQQVCFDI